MVAAKEAKKILLEQRKRNRERQKEHMEKKRAEGYRRISVLISDKAHKALEQAAKNQGKTKSELVADAILSACGDNKTNVSVINKNYISTNISIKKKSFDRKAIMVRIMELRGQGLSYQNIADQLDDEGIPTAKGGKWQRGTVSKMIWKKGGSR